MDKIGSDVMAELLLIGNIVRNMELIDTYRECLAEDDFEDEAARLAYRFLREYVRQFGTEVTESYTNALYVDRFMQDKRFKQCFQGKPYKMLREAKELGVDNCGANNAAFKDVKRNKTIRVLHEQGFPIEKLLEGKNIKELTVDDIFELVQGELEACAPNITLRVAEDMGSNLVELAHGFLVSPEVGVQTPFSFVNEHMHGLYKNDLTMIGGTSNSGKGRFLMNLLTYLVCVEHQRVYLISNEMTYDDFLKSMICTLVNSPAIQKLHGKELRIRQSDIVLSKFRDREGEVIERGLNETVEDFEARLLSESEEYGNYLEVVQWFQDNYSGHFYFSNITDGYSVERLKAELRKAEKKGCSIVAYDTMKSYQSTEWGDLVLTATALSEYVKASPSGIHGIATFQLTDDVNYIKPEELGSSKISGAKNIIQVADNMLMFKQLHSYQKNCYQMAGKSIPEDVKMACFKIVKTRRGGGKEVMYGVQNNLDYNCWEYIAEMEPIGGRKQVG